MFIPELDLPSTKLENNKIPFFFTTVVGFRSFQCWKTLSSKWKVVLFWGVDWFYTLNGFPNMENDKILPYKVPKYQKIHFWGTSGCWIGIICLHTPTKSSLAVILRGQPSFSDHRFTRYGFYDFFAPSGLFPGYFRLTNYDPKNGTCFFWLSLSHIINFWRENESICKCTREVTQLLQ